MKRLIAVLAVATFVVLGSLTAAVADNGPAEIKFPNKMGEVTFKHADHQAKAGDCKVCHEAAPGKIEGFGKDIAHKTCKGCHQEKGGPTGCKDCHSGPKS